MARWQAEQQRFVPYDEQNGGISVPASAPPMQAAGTTTVASGGLGVDSNRIPGLTALARGVGPKLTQGFSATRESKHCLVKEQYGGFKRLSQHVRDNCLRSCLSGVEQTRELVDIMTGSGGELHVFYNDIRAPATNRTMAGALLSLEISQIQVSEVENAVRVFLEGARIDEDDIIRAIRMAEKELDRTVDSVQLCKKVERVLEGTGTLVGAATTVGALAAAHLAVGGAAAVSATVVSGGGAAVVGVIALVALFVYLHRSNLRTKAALGKAEQAQLEDASKEMLQFIAAMTVFKSVIDEIHGELAKLCRECERMDKRLTPPAPGEFPDLRSALRQSERIYKDCQAYEQILHEAINSITESLEYTERQELEHESRMRNAVASEPDVAKPSGCGCFSFRRR